MERLPRFEFGQLLNTFFELGDFLSECFGFLTLGSGKLIFETLQAGFFLLVVYLGFSDILAFLDLIAAWDIDEAVCV
jgi:hypothetical protein